MDAAVKHAEQFRHTGNETRGTNTRMPIGLRDWPLVKVTMRNYHIKESDVAKAAQLASSSVSDALNFKRFHKCSYITVVKVRTTIELLLDDAGWPQVGDEAYGVSMLWQDYDQRMEDLL